MIRPMVERERVLWRERGSEGAMEIFLIWLGLMVIVGFLAARYDRSVIGWVLLALLVSVLMAGLLLLVLGQAGKSCPRSAETCRKDARVCRHCGQEFAAALPS